MENKKPGIVILLMCVLIGVVSLSCGAPAESGLQTAPQEADRVLKNEARTPRLALWLAKKDELLKNDTAGYDLVMTGWVEPQEVVALTERCPSTAVLGGLSHTWILEDEAWLRFLHTVANGGDPDGALQITEDMFLMIDSNGDGILDRKCGIPGWEGLYAMDPRHPEWQAFILSFYKAVALQEQHQGVIIDMVDAYPFCDGYQSRGVPKALGAEGWIDAQAALLAAIRKNIPDDKWLIANAGHDFDAGSPFPQYLNGYLLENFLGEWGAGLEEGLASAQRALGTTRAPHIVVFAVDTDDSGEIDWARFRTGLAASLMMDNTYFAFDYGARDHGGVTDWWFADYYTIDLGNPLGDYIFTDGGYRRDFEKGIVVIAYDDDISLIFDADYQNIVNGETGNRFLIPQGDAGFFVVN